MLRFGPAISTRPFQPSCAAAIRALKGTLVAGLLLGLAACGGGGGDSGSFDSGGTPSSPPPSANITPIYALGSGSGSTYQDGVINASQTTLRAGESATLRVNVVTTNRNNEPPTDAQTVTFSSICTSSGRAAFGNVTAVSNGLYSVQYTNNGCDGADTVTATLGANNDTATVAMTMVGPQVLTVSFVSSTHDQLTLAGIGGNESTELTFKVAGPQGVPIIGKQVGFSINTAVGGASILTGRETGITDQDGFVRTVLNSGTVAGPVSVLATHLESGKQGSSSDIIVSTGVPVANRFSMSYQPFNPVGAWNTDGITVSITIIASDVFGNNPTDGTRVSFVAPESGNVQNSCQLVDGTCTVVWRSTAPRPADMRVEVIAYTDGAENFVDQNGNSLYDSADGPVADMGEPYADENEDDGYDLGEFFFDTNRNGVRDTGNGQWDGPCLQNVNPAAVCTGNNTVSVFETITIVMPTDSARILALGSFPPPGSTITLASGTPTTLTGMMLGDSNTNADALGSNPLPFGTTITFSVQGSGITVQGISTYTVPNALGPIGPIGVTLATQPVSGDPVPPSMLMTIAIPGRATQQYSWPITIQ
ncbi:MAG: hypothetical protein ACO1PZ_08445 [Gammaproteobacteria bacterium]